jgi:hypothetical protein
MLKLTACEKQKLTLVVNIFLYNGKEKFSSSGSLIQWKNDYMLGYRRTNGHYKKEYGCRLNTARTKHITISEVLSTSPPYISSHRDVILS